MLCAHRAIASVSFGLACNAPRPFNETATGFHDFQTRICLVTSRAPPTRDTARTALFRAGLGQGRPRPPYIKISAGHQ